MLQLVSRWFYGLLWFFAVAVFLLHYAVAGQAVYGDGIGYYAHLHSWYFDHDWNYTNEYQHIYNPENNNRAQPEQSPVVQIVKTTSAGTAENHYSPGTALLLLPFYVVADGLARLAQLVSLPVATTGYSDIYQLLVGLGAVSYVIAGLWLLERVVLKFVPDGTIARAGVVLTFLGTQLLYYGSFDVINSHFASFFLSVTFFYVLLHQPPSLFRNVSLGLIAGLAASVRLQDGVLAVVWWMALSFDVVRDQKPPLGEVLKKVVSFHFSFILGFLPSLYHMVSVFESPLQHRYWLGFLAEREQGKVISWVGSLWHPTTGLFTVTPILAVAFGFFVYLVYKQKVSNSLWLLASFFILQYVIITVQAGWQAAAYGGRMYISSLPFFAVVLVLLMEKFKTSIPVTKLALFMMLVVVLNFWQMGSFILFGKGAEGGNFGTEQRTLQRINTFRQVFFN